MDRMTTEENDPTELSDHPAGQCCAKDCFDKTQSLQDTNGGLNQVEKNTAAGKDFEEFPAWVTKAAR